MNLFVTTLLTALIMLFIDVIWLGSRMTYHNTLIKNIQGTPPNLRVIPAILIYILIPIAVIVFAVAPSVNIKSAALKGAFLGLSMYGVYDLTNYATFTNYTLEMTLIDMTWGSILCAAGASIGFLIHRHPLLQK